MPLFRFLQIGMLGGGNGVSSTCCRLPQLVLFWPMFTFGCGSDVFPFGSVCKTVPLFYFLFGDYIFWLNILSNPFDNLISIENVFVQLFHSTFVMITRFAMQLRAFAATNCFLCGFPCLGTNALAYCSFLRSCFFTSSLASGIIRLLMTFLFWRRICFKTSQATSLRDCEEPWSESKHWGRWSLWPVQNHPNRAKFQVHPPQVVTCELDNKLEASACELRPTKRMT